MATECVVCNESENLFFCPGNNCDLAYCRVCAEFMVNSGNTKCSCSNDVVGPMSAHFMDELNKKLLDLTLRREVDARVSKQVREMEVHRTAREARLEDQNNEAKRLANCFQEQMMDSCPSCKAAFNDFDGCNSLTCATCNAKFCSLCLHPGECKQHGHSYGHNQYLMEREKRVALKFSAFVKHHFNGWMDSRLFRLFASQLSAIGVKVAAVADMVLPSAGSNPITSVDQFITTCCKQVDSRVEEERCMVFDRQTRRVRSDVAVPKEYSVLLMREDKRDDDIYKVVIYKTIDHRIEEVKVEQLEDDLNIRWIYTAVICTKQGLVFQTQKASFGGCTVQVVRDGKVSTMARVREIEVAGILGNRRLMDSQRYLQELTPTKVTEPVKALIGAIPNKSLVTALNADILESAVDLNVYQRKVVDLTRMRQSQVVVGPPGTGKSRTIVALIYQMLEQFPATHMVVLTSEKNGAIEAVAAHMRSACVNTTNGEVTDVSFFEKVLCFGSSSLKAAGKSFTMDEKLKTHPDLVSKLNAVKLKANAMAAAGKRMKCQLDNNIKEIKSSFEMDVDDEIIACLAPMLNSASDFKGIMALFQQKLQSLSLSSKQGAAMVKCLGDAVRDIDDSLPNLEEVTCEYMKLQQEYDILKREVQVKMNQCSRVLLATIGSMHKIQRAVQTSLGEVEDEGGCGQPDGINQDMLQFHFILDESSTVPQFEICSLGQIGSVASVSLFGDPNQLSPYSFITSSARHTVSSVFAVDNKANRHYLELQYRIPRLIAKVLSEEVYNGRYLCDANLSFNAHPVLLVHAPRALSGDNSRIRDYKNEAEATLAVQLLIELRDKNVMVLTPYKDQVREIKVQYKRHCGRELDIDKVITVDQSQGQESDIVIISMCKSIPTKFLDMNRLTVMVSRCKNGLILLSDIPVLQSACQHMSCKVLSSLLDVGTQDREKIKWL